MRSLFVLTSGLVLLDVIAQFFFAGLGVFNRPQTAESFSLHSMNFMIILALVLLNTIVAALARAGGRTAGLAFLPGLLTILQIVLFIVGDAFIPADVPRDADGIPVVVDGAARVIISLHVLNGLIILGIAVLVFRRARMLAGAATPIGAGHEAPVAS